MSVKIEINGVEFETPLWVSGRTVDLVWFGKKLVAYDMAPVAGAESEMSFCTIDTDDGWIREAEERKRRYEENVLREADRIRAVRA